MFDALLTTFFLLCAGVAFAVIMRSTSAGFRQWRANSNEIAAIDRLRGDVWTA